MPNRLIILGAGGHSKVVADIALKNGYTDILFADDGKVGSCLGFPVLGNGYWMAEMNDGHTDFIIAVGDHRIRQRLVAQYDLPWVTLVHPSAKVGVYTSIGAGTVVMANAVINPGATIGNHCIINSGAVVEHDNTIGNFVHISPLAALGGTVSIGDGTHVGIGAAVSNNVSICEECIIGTGAAVVKDITQRGVYVGVPAKKREEPLL